MSNWDIPVTPLSGVENCHAEGVYSFWFGDDLRMFACLNWTGLAANDYGDVVGFHNHNRDIAIKVAFGEIENIEALWTGADMNGTRPYKLWRWDPALRGGTGRFARQEGIYSCIEVREMRTLTGGSRAYTMPWHALHTVKQTTKKVAWFVRESGPLVEGHGENWSRNDLSEWHKQADFYRPLEHRDMLDAWNEVRGLAMNARKRSGSI